MQECKIGVGGCGGKLYNTFLKHAGNKCNVEIEYIKNFELTSGGKRRYFIAE